MRKIRFFAISLFLVTSLLTLPVYGQTELDLIIKTTDGYIIPLFLSEVAGLDLPIKNYYVDSKIGMTWEVNMKGLELPDLIKPSPKIEIKDKDNEPIESDYINGTKGELITFTVETDSGALLSCEYPAPLGSNNTFNSKYDTSGTYLAIFKAEKDQDYSLRIIKLIITDSLQKTYSLTTSVNPSGGGTITIDPSGGSYPEGTKVTLTAKANTGYTFTEWSGDINGTQNPLTITMDKDYKITANFQSQGTGPYSEKVRIAQPVDKWDGKGDYVVSNFGISKNQTKYFLIDPKKFGISFPENKSVTYIYFQVRDRYQAKYVDIYYPIIYKLNANDELIQKYIVPGSGEFSYIVKGFTRDEYNSGVKFLLEISEKGFGSQNDGLTVMWHFS